MLDPAELQAKLQLLNDAYAAQLPEKFRQIEQAGESLRQAVWDEEGFQILHRLVHSLSGSGKTFGFSALSEAARALENELKLIGEAKQVLDDAQRDRIGHLLRELECSASQRDSAVVLQSESIATSTPSPTANFSGRICVVEDNLEMADELQAHLSYFGYEVSVFLTLDDFRRAMPRHSNDVVLMDVNFPEDSLGGIHVMTELQRGRDVPLPVIFLSAHNGLDVRLGAVRAGGVAYLNKPVNIGILVDKLDAMTSTQVSAAYRVLIVDDSASLASYYAEMLKQAGMIVRVVNDPLEVLGPLFDFSPDLILVDMYMPGCTGTELAQVIRQIDEFISIPIVFLSAETDLGKQLSAVGFGGDDFLTKPIEAEHLVASVTSRIKRSLVLRSYMVRDSLTGLLNHTAIKDRLAHELARAKRQGKSLAFAMLDIDHFKQVNDAYGHPVGDRVIKSLSRLLKQRLRENDLVGRYGGEEFAVILADADAAAAMKVLDSIREDFSRLRHLAEDQEFSTSFSCGIADNSNFGEGSKLTDAADKALYKAKHAGRNRILIAG
ncbi:MAG: diguanylate cyclase [Gallionella sp.]|nr:diguanylate cyclase [Gallionella sp.]